MPEYLAPGVYVEETSFRPKTIEGVSTSTAGFVGPARYGPTSGAPELLTSFADFERMFGGLDALEFDGDELPNFLAHGVRAFFEEGGRRCYVSRIYSGTNGHASVEVSSGDATLHARFPGTAGNMRIGMTLQRSGNLLVSDPISGDPQIRRVQERDTVFLEVEGGGSQQGVYDLALEDEELVLRPATGDDVQIGDLDPDTMEVFQLTVDVSIERPIIRPQRPGLRFDTEETLQDFSLHPRHSRSLTAYFSDEPRTRQLRLTVPFRVELGGTTPADPRGAHVVTAIFGSDLDEPVEFMLEDGSDGDVPGAETYRGDSLASNKSGLAALEDVEDISIVAAPGYSFDYTGNESRVETIQAHLIIHCERLKYRVAVLDSPDELSLSEVGSYRGKIDTKYAALYYPWITVLDPATQQELDLPPSGFVAGIYARNDVERGVHKAPANEVVRLAVGFEFMINHAQQEVLNPAGINCFRFFEGRGHRLWGARTATSDPEWKYVNLRRYFAYLERSIDKGTQWVVFENNGDALWANVRRTVEDYLFNEWKQGRLMGLTPDEAFFVRCDRTTMTQNDIDNGRLICLIGVAPLRPAEFVIFRIGQKLLETRG